MKCSEVQKVLREVVKGIRQTLAADSRQHLENCDLCKQYHSDLMLSKKLMSLEVPEPSANFIEHSLDKAISKNQSRTGVPANVWSMVAMLIIGIMLGVLFSSHQITHENSSGLNHPVALVAAQSKLVNIVIDSEEYQSDVTITISLSDNIEIEGYPATQKLSWQTELLKGSNLLTLPLILQSGSEGYFEISYTAGKDTQRVKMKIVAEPARQPQVRPSI